VLHEDGEGKWAGGGFVEVSGKVREGASVVEGGSFLTSGIEFLVLMK